MRPNEEANLSYKFPDWVCYIDSGGFYLGEREKIDFLFQHPKHTFSLSEDDECDCDSCVNNSPDFPENSEDDEAAEEEFYPEQRSPENESDKGFDDILEGSNESEIVLIQAQDRSHLWSILRKLAAEFKVNSGVSMRASTMIVQMTCGRIKAITAFDDIPLKSLKCGCDHEWIIKYKGK